ncbi:putative Response regulator [Gammaproteobacteria bacterium]
MSKLNLLVVDDVSTIRNFVRQGLISRMPQVEVLEASNGRRAQEIMTSKPIDMLLCDWEMPEVNGKELLLWMRGDERFQHLPFIMVTGFTDRKYVVDALRAGIDDYIIKPFSIDILAERIHGVLAKRKQDASAQPITKESGDSADSDDAASFPSSDPDNKTVDGHKDNPLARLKAKIRLKDRNIRCIVKQLEPQAVTLIVLREVYRPGILEFVTLDLTLPPIEVLDIKGFVSGIEAVEPSTKTRFLQLTLHFVDEENNPTQRDQLASLFSGLNPDMASVPPAPD